MFENYVGISHNLNLKMEAAKKAKKMQRSSFTKSLKTFSEKCTDTDVPQADKHVAFQLLESRMLELVEANKAYLYLLMASNTTEEEIMLEVDSHEVYKEQFLTARMQRLSLDSGSSATRNVNPARHAEKPFKRPTLEIPKFNGSGSDWLDFSSHFEKIDATKSITKEYKLAYLKQRMEKGSKAEKILEGFPTTASNYEKAYSLKSRFGRNNLLIEFYTHELLSLALQNATNNGKKLSVSSIYDKISAQIRALDTLGVKTKQCATMLYPLVESSLPEEILRTWQRSMINHETAPEDGEDPPFLESEVENEERINMAVNGFSFRSGQEKSEKLKEVKESISSSAEVPTATALFSNEEKRKVCIFCGENYENALYETNKPDTLAPVDKVTEQNLSNFCDFPNVHL